MKPHIMSRRIMPSSVLAALSLLLAVALTANGARTGVRLGDRVSQRNAPSEASALDLPGLRRGDITGTPETWFLFML